MDVHLAVASKRDARRYAPGPLPPGAEERILDAGRLAGSARNRQPCRFVVAEGDAIPAVARGMYSPANALGAALVVGVVVTPGGGLVDFDAGRAAQSMMLAAWAEGIASCPNGIADRAAVEAALAVAPPERAVVILTFGRREGRDPARRGPGEWSRRAPRLPLEAVVRRVGGGLP